MPYTRSGKCVYKKSPDGSRGEKKGCSDSEEEAKQYMKRLYSLDETDSELLDEDIVGRGREMQNERLIRQLIRELLDEPIQDPVVNSVKGVADELAALIVQDPRFELGGRKNRVQRIYPVKPSGKSKTKATEEDFKDTIQSFVIPGNPAGKYEIVPPKSSRYGFQNGSSKFNMILVVPGGGGNITHPKYREGDYIPIMLAGGGSANVGQGYENSMAVTLQAIAAGTYWPAAGGEEEMRGYGILGMLEKMGLNIEKMSGATVTQTKPSKRPIKSAPYNVGPQIADIIITDVGPPKYISVKNIKGKTFGNHGYAGGFVLEKSSDGSEKIVPGTGPGNTDRLVAALGIDKARVARGVTNYLNQTEDEFEESQWQKGSGDVDRKVIQGWLASGIGFGYYYVREAPGGSIKVIHLADAADAMDFIGEVRNVTLRYPRPGKSKQLTAVVSTSNGTFKVELRNTSGGIVPNQINLSVGSNFIPPEYLLETRKLIRRLIRETFLSDHLFKSCRRSFID